MPASQGKSSDIPLLFVTRVVRLLAYGSMSVVLVLYLDAVGVNEREIGVLLTMTLLGDTAISLWITTSADRIGRKKMLILGAGLMVVAGLVFIATNNFALLLIAATFGVISPSGSEVGPFLAIEQASLSGTLEASDRTAIFGWYNLAGGGAGFLMIETPDPRELNEILEPYMPLMSFDVHAVYELPYQETIRAFKEKVSTRA